VNRFWVVVAPRMITHLNHIPRCRTRHSLHRRKIARRAQTGLAAVRHADLNLTDFGATNRMTVFSPS